LIGSRSSSTVSVNLVNLNSSFKEIDSG